MKKANDTEEKRERLHRIRRFFRKLALCVSACVAILKEKE